MPASQSSAATVWLLCRMLLIANLLPTLLAAAVPELKSDEVVPALLTALQASPQPLLGDALDICHSGNLPQPPANPATRKRVHPEHHAASMRVLTELPGEAVYLVGCLLDAGLLDVSQLPDKGAALLYK
jgi:hypothetical protein